MRVEWQCDSCERWNMLGEKRCSSCQGLKPFQTKTRSIPDLARKQAEQWNRKLGIHHRHLKKK